MKNIERINNPYNDDKIISACSIFGAINTTGEPFSGTGVIDAIATMHDRGNGLGGGFAVYGIYPAYAEYYAFHIMYLSNDGRAEAEEFLRTNFAIIDQEEIPTRECSKVVDPPALWRYFIDVPVCLLEGETPDEYVVDKVNQFNSEICDSFIFSSGKNMGIFKGVGYPEDIAEFFALDNYRGYIWTAHGRFPTNTHGWWGGAHPFGLCDWTVVHNGEISSYGTNRRYLEQYGYACTMHTDTEVVLYGIDLLVRKHGIAVEMLGDVFSAPLWSEIERYPSERKQMAHTLRQVYSSLLLNGPFSILVAHHNELIGLTDRIRLRPLVIGESGSMVYMSSEESAISLISPHLDRTWIPEGGQPVIARVSAKPRLEPALA